jgi:hypothetical protein
MNKLKRLVKHSKNLEGFLNSLRAFGRYYLDQNTILWRKNDFVMFYLSIKGGN